MTLYCIIADVQESHLRHTKIFKPVSTTKCTVNNVVPPERTPFLSPEGTRWSVQVEGYNGHCKSKAETLMNLLPGKPLHSVSTS